jgi:bifunctional DNA primase/polymerase-like protein
MSARPAHIQRILDLTGPALLLPLARSKGSRRNTGWTKWPLALMDDPIHQDRLAKAGNIGVANGKVSGDLCNVDVDVDGLVEPFLDANPALRETLTTKGKRGAVFWVRIDGEYPDTFKIKTDGSLIGEFRSNGAQTIIAGTHPEGMPYQFLVEKPAITVAFSQLVFPVFDSLNHSDRELVSHLQRVREAESKRVRETNELCVGSSLSLSLTILNNREELLNQVRSLAPTDFGQTNHSLRMLARLNLSIERVLGRKTTVKEKQGLFDLWCQMSRPWWRRTREEYWSEFLEMCEWAKVGITEDPLQIAYARAGAEPLPEVVGVIDERIRRIAGMCRQLDIMLGGRPFYLPTRKLAQMTGFHWTSIANFLRAFEILGHIALAPGEVRRRGGIRSPRYIYTKQTEPEAPPPQQPQLT